MPNQTQVKQFALKLRNRPVLEEMTQEQAYKVLVTFCNTYGDTQMFDGTLDLRNQQMLWHFVQHFVGFSSPENKALLEALSHRAQLPEIGEPDLAILRKGWETLDSASLKNKTGEEIMAKHAADTLAKALLFELPPKRNLKRTGRALSKGGDTKLLENGEDSD